MPSGLLSFLHFVPVRQSVPLGSAKCSTRSRRDWHSPFCVAKSFEEAIDRGFVKDFGRTIKLDPDGFFPLRNELRVSDTLRKPLQDVISSIRHAMGWGLVRAIFLRGSVATGSFTGNGRSDLDLIVVTRKPISRNKKLMVHGTVSRTVKDALGLSGADVRYVHHTSSWFRTNTSDITQSIRILLRNYSVLLYCDDKNVGIEDSRDKPTGDEALDIRNHERSFLQLFNKGTEENDFSLQRDAIQWICKTSLRAVAELASLSTNLHSRDLVPCYKLGTIAFPDHTKTLLLGLQIACACADNRYLELPKSDFLDIGFNISRDMVEIVEELSLRRNFGVSPPSLSELSSTTSPELFPSRSWTQDITEFLTKSLSQTRRALNPKQLNLEELSFLRSNLPCIRIKLSPTETKTQIRQETTATQAGNCLSQHLLKTSAPFIVKGIRSVNMASSIDTASILEDLMKTVIMVQCRVSPGNEFTFCRGVHPWLDAKKFSPPSVLTSITVEDAVLRMCEDCSLPPLVYTESNQERIYIQTKIPSSQRIFTGIKRGHLRVAQEERMWISTHGSVSGLHFDSSYSALFQRAGSKRMLFFPPECLEYMGIYPLGHPLHRRSRINLTRPESQLFQEFWRTYCSKGIEVIVKEGDLVVFPPFWTHYTESLSSDSKELSISHTLRFI